MAAVLVQQPPPTATVTIPTSQPQTTTMNMKVNAVRGLGITQVVIGFLCVILGIAVVATLDTRRWETRSGAGIWGGIWILVTGILGICSASFSKNGCLNGTHMAFCIVATVITWIDGIIFSSAIGHYNSCREYYHWLRGYSWICSDNPTTGRALNSVLLVLMIFEFAIALAAAILCCQATSACCGPSQKAGVVITSQQQPQLFVASSAAPVHYNPNPLQFPPQQMAYSQPQQLQAVFTSHGAVYPKGAYSSPHTQSINVQAMGAHHDNTAVAYSAQHDPPPSYSGTN